MAIIATAIMILYLKANHCNPFEDLASVDSICSRIVAQEITTNRGGVEDELSEGEDGKVSIQQAEVMADEYYFLVSFNSHFY